MTRRDLFKRMALVVVVPFLPKPKPRPAWQEALITATKDLFNPPGNTYQQYRAVILSDTPDFEWYAPPIDPKDLAACVKAMADEIDRQCVEMFYRGHYFPSGGTKPTTLVYVDDELIRYNGKGLDRGPVDGSRTTCPSEVGFRVSGAGRVPGRHQGARTRGAESGGAEGQEGGRRGAPQGAPEVAEHPRLERRPRADDARANVSLIENAQGDAILVTSGGQGYQFRAARHGAGREARPGWDLTP